MSLSGLYWLPSDPDWPAKVKAVERDKPVAWDSLVALANAKLDFIRTERLDTCLRGAFGTAPPKGLATKPVRLALLASSTVAHLQPAMRVAALRRGIHLTIYEADYGQYLQELLDADSGLHEFKPNTVLFALDARHLTSGADVAADAPQADAIFNETVDKLASCWRLAREAFRCPVLQQTVLPVLPPVLGNNEHRLPGSRASASSRASMPRCAGWPSRRASTSSRSTSASARDGIALLARPGLWHRAKQEITPRRGAALWRSGRRGCWPRSRAARPSAWCSTSTTRSGAASSATTGWRASCSARAARWARPIVAFQDYARELIAPRRHPRGVLQERRGQRAGAVRAAPRDGAEAQRHRHASSPTGRTRPPTSAPSPSELNIGLDSLVFVDDNPFERNLVRQELPMVAVPEAAGRSDALSRMHRRRRLFRGPRRSPRRTASATQLNIRPTRERDALKASATDLHGLSARPGDAAGLEARSTGSGCSASCSSSTRPTSST